jgi:iron complex transport system ATP-binding protein
MSKLASLVSAHNTTLWRGTTCVFRNLNLDIRQHEQVAILGPNGCGKTTLLKAINREIYPVKSAGSSFRILGQDRWNVWDLRKQIGTVSDDLQQRYSPCTSGLDVVLSGFFSSVGVHGMLARDVTGEQLARANAILEQLQLAELSDRQLRHMSTGQQRRILLARALVHEPGTLILDEPTSGLDLASCFEYLGTIRRLASAGCNILMATHDLSEIPPETDRIIVLRDGRVVADGPKAEVLDAGLLSRVYGVSVRIREADGYYFAYPGK